MLILASGGLVHDLGELDWEREDAPVAPWAREAEGWILERLAAGDRGALVDHRARLPHGRRAAATTEHLDPLFVALGAAGVGAPRTFLDAWQHGTLSLRGLVWE